LVAAELHVFNLSTHRRHDQHKIKGTKRQKCKYGKRSDVKEKMWLSSALHPGKIEKKYWSNLRRTASLLKRHSIQKTSLLLGKAPSSKKP